MAFVERLRKWHPRPLNWLQGQDTIYLVLLAVVVGVLSGYAALLLRLAIEWVSLLWTDAHTWEQAMERLPWYIYLIAPTIAGLFIGIMITRLMPNGELRGVSGVLADLVERRGRIDKRQMATETVGTAVSIGSGASLGREGPTVALGALIASEIGQRMNLTEQQTRTLIGCGVAAGIAASFNTPIAGVLFALEVILADYTIATFSPIVIAAVLATIITRAELGNFPAFTIPGFQLISAWEIPAYLLMGIICGLIASLLVKSLAPMRRFLARLVPDRRIRPAVAGFVVGLIGLLIPHVMSIGYDTVAAMMLEQIEPSLLSHSLPLWLFLAILLVGKLIATMLSSAGGFPGGLLGPSLFLGACVGALFGGIAHGLVPAYSESYGAYALVACGALTAAALQAPITIMLMVFELTTDYHIMLPLMAACSVATLVARAFGRASVFTEALEERGINTEWGREQSWLRAIKVTQIPWRTIPSVHMNTPLAELKRIYVSSGKGCVQIVDDEGLMIGIVTFADLQNWLLDQSLDHAVIAAEVANRNVHVISENGSLLEAIRTFDQESYEQIPVVSANNPRKVLGVLARHAVFQTYHQLIVKHGEHLDRTHARAE